jgi:hypothetical protein
MKLNLLRAVLAQVGNGNESLGIQAQLGDTAIFTTRAVRMLEKHVSNVLVASVPVEVAVEADNSIEIPDEPRKQAEATLETVVRLMAIDRQLRHSLSSPIPFIGFSSEDPSNVDKMDGVTVNSTFAVMPRGLPRPDG